MDHRKVYVGNHHFKRADLASELSLGAENWHLQELMVCTFQPIVSVRFEACLIYLFFVMITCFQNIFLRNKQSASDLNI